MTIKGIRRERERESFEVIGSEMGVKFDMNVN
jgi:hypothetical protein